MKIEVNGLNFAYANRPVLNITAAQFEPGLAYGIVGRNGVGKTTFFKCLVNIITTYGGSIRMDGLEVKNHLHMLGRVGIVLDDTNLYPNRTGLFNLKYFAGLRGGVSDMRVYELAKELEIDQALPYKVSTYSLGMVKKLQLLISLMNDANVLIFDEPFRGLDAKTVDWFRNYLIKLKNEGRTILISSHVQEDIESISDKVMVLEHGDFRHVFDLNDKTQAFIYTVEVSDQAGLIEILDQYGVKHRENEKVVQFITYEPTYHQLFETVVAAGIQFYQIKKEAQFAKFVK